MNLKFSFRLLLVMLLLCGSANAQEFFKTNTSGGGFNVLFGNQAFGFPGYFNKDSADLSYAFRRNAENKSIDSAFFSRPEGGLTTLGFQGFGICFAPARLPYFEHILQYMRHIPQDRDVDMDHLVDRGGININMRFG